MKARRKIAWDEQEVNHFLLYHTVPWESIVNALVQKLRTLRWPLRPWLHVWRIRILGKNAEENAWEELRPYLESLARGAQVPPEASPEELINGAMWVLNQLTDHWVNVDEREQRQRHTLRELVDQHLVPAEVVRSQEGVNTLLQSLLQQHIAVPTTRSGRDLVLDSERDTSCYHH